MPWARIDDRANGNAKLLALSDGGWRLWGCGLIYCQANLTDGFIPTHAIETFGVRAKSKRRLIDDELAVSLVPGKGPLWHTREAGDGWDVHDYLDWNDSRDAILRDRNQAKGRFERYKQRVRNGVANAPETPPQQVSTSTTTDREDQNQVHGRAPRAASPEAEQTEIKLLAALCTADILQPYRAAQLRLPEREPLIAAVMQAASAARIPHSERTTAVAVDRALRAWEPRRRPLQAVR